MGASGKINGVSLAAGSDLVTINELALIPSLADGEVLDLKIEDFELVRSVSGTLTSEKNLQINAGKITIGSA